MRNLNTYLCLVLSIIILLLSCSEGSDVSFGDTVDGSSAQSGSYANMITVGDRLFIVSRTSLITMDITAPLHPVEIYREQLSFDLESLFINGNTLFVGSQTNLYIYNINENGIPEEASVTPYFQFDNICPRDPVVANDSIAYVTLSSDDFQVVDNCGRAQIINELRLYNIVDIENPELINTVELDTPKGLGFDQELLFICEKNKGIKVFNIADPLDVKLIDEDLGFAAQDVIVLRSQNRLLVVGGSAVRQYDYDEVGNLSFISLIAL